MRYRSDIEPAARQTPRVKTLPLNRLDVRDVGRVECGAPGGQRGVLGPKAAKSKEKEEYR